MVDDLTAQYIAQNQRCFENFQQAASQLAGLLLLAAAGSPEATPDHPALAGARALFREAEDALRRARPTDRSREHHEHIQRAAEMIGTALKDTGGALDVDRVLIPLRAGYAELERAVDALPGFEKISYARACCGVRLP